MAPQAQETLPNYTDEARKGLGFTVAEVVEHYSVHEQTVRRWMKDGDIPSFKYGRYRLVPERFLVEYGLPGVLTYADARDAANRAVDEWAANVDGDSPGHWGNVLSGREANAAQ